MSKTFAGNYFEDFELNSTIEHGTPRSITSGDVSLYIALTGSRFAINCADTVARACGFEQTPLDNFLLFHIAFGKTVPEISLNAVANLGYAECSFKQPTYVGDTISVNSKVIGLKENSNGKTGVVYVHSVATNQHNTIVVEWKRWVMVHKKDASAPLGINSTPNLKPRIDDLTQVVPEHLNFDQFNCRWSASEFMWQDYQVGEIIDHVDGLTINDSDHSLATRLYQNNAKVHFDQHYMNQTPHGKRLVYGGHIISMCRALSHNGLANGMWLASINGGSHTNPSFAGDTIYAQSHILESGSFDRTSNTQDARSDTTGWLRVVTYGIKDYANFPLKEYLNKRNEHGGKLSKDDPLQSAIVLELDYTLLVPKRIT